MKNRVTNTWKNVPTAIRKPVVFILGLLLIIASGLTGWLPGPGGIPLFLLGIAILATEFEWAEKIRDKVLGWLKAFGRWYRSNPFLGTLAVTVVIFALIGIAFLINRQLNVFFS